MFLVDVCVYFVLFYKIVEIMIIIHFNNTTFHISVNRDFQKFSIQISRLVRIDLH